MRWRKRTAVCCKPVHRLALSIATGVPADGFAQKANGVMGLARSRGFWDAPRMLLDGA
jgi:hypothetical protein